MEIRIRTASSSITAALPRVLRSRDGRTRRIRSSIATAPSPTAPSRCARCRDIAMPRSSAPPELPPPWASTPAPSSCVARRNIFACASKRPFGAKRFPPMPSPWTAKSASARFAPRMPGSVFTPESLHRSTPSARRTLCSARTATRAGAFAPSPPPRFGITRCRTITAQSGRMTTL